METTANERSPLRLLEELSPEGLGEGNLGLIIGRTGTGKTACLVQFALDHLTRGHRVLHIGLDEPVQRIRRFYDESFVELAKNGGLDKGAVTQVDLERNRHIHSYLGHSFTVEKLREAVRFLREHVHFIPRVIVIDGLKLEDVTEDDVKALLAQAAELQAELWITASAHRKELEGARDGLPSHVERLRKYITVIAELRGDEQGLHLIVHKAHSDESGEYEVDAILDSASMQVLRKL